MLNKKRPIIFPNFGFQRQLVEFEKQLAERYAAKDIRAREKSRDESYKQTIEVENKDSSSYTPYSRHNKLSVYENKLPLGKSFKPHQRHEQLKPTQFHYP